MSTPEQSLEARELSLVGKVELRIALADTDAKLEQLLSTYLAPLLMKLASDSVQVRSKVISVCQHVNTRLKSQGIKLPVAALLKQFKETTIPLIRHFDILYIQQGISKLEISKRLELLPVLIGGISKDVTANSQHGAQLFHLILQLLHHFKLPQKGTKEDESLRKELNVADEDAAFLSLWFSKFILLSIQRNDQAASSRQCPGLTEDEYQVLTVHGKPEAWDPTASGGLSLPETKAVVMRFLSSGIFTNHERFYPALFASADTNSRIRGTGEDLIKHSQSEIDLEDSSLVEKLYELYFGGQPPSGAPPIRTPLRNKILGLLSRSRKSLEYPAKIKRLVEEGFAGNNGDGFSIIAPTGLEATKFHDSIFSFVTFAARNGKPEQLKAIVPELTSQLRAFVEDQGWPVNTSGDTRLRGFAYGAIGLLGKTVPEIVVDDPKATVLSWLFKSLNEDNSGSEVLMSIQDALSSLMASYPRQFLNRETESAFKQLLLRNMGSEESGSQPGESHLPRTGPRRNVQYVATRFANRCLPYNDVVARWIDILAMSADGTDSRELVEEGKRGLDPYWHVKLESSLRPITETTSDGEPTASLTPLPDFPTLVDYIFQESLKHEDDMVVDTNPIQVVEAFNRRHPFSIWPAVQYSRLVLMRAALREEKIEPDLTDDWERKLNSLVTSDEKCRNAVRKHIAHTAESGGQSFRSMAILLRGSFDILVSSAKTTSTGAAESFLELFSLSPDGLPPSIHLTSEFSSLEEAVYSNDIPTRTLGAHAFGLLASHQKCDSSQVKACLERFVKIVESWEHAVGGELNRACGATLALAYFFSRATLRGYDSFIFESINARYLAALFQIVEKARDNAVRNAAAISVGQLSLFSALSPSIIEKHVPFSTLVDKIGEIAQKGSSRAILTLGYLAVIVDERESEQEKSPLHSVETKLRSLSDIRDAETHFSVGEALSIVTSGWESTSLINMLDVPAGRGTESSLGASRDTTLSRIVKELIIGCRASKPSLRKASVIWLLCIVQFCGHLDATKQQFRQCQVAFKRCLSDRDDVIQEAASRGLGLVYEKGDIKDDLVKDLIGMFSDNKAQLAGTVSDDTELFEEGALPTGDGSVTTYKDILSLASEVGDSSLVYRFMALASNNSIWSTRAAFGRFGLSNVFSDSSTDGYLAKNPKLYPKLFRYRFDPNPNVQRSMKDIWDALVKDSSATINTHFDAIMEDLLKNVLAKEWRTREACCAAISDLLQGRPFEKYENFLPRVWESCFKVLDDIKDSVRKAAASLSRVLTGILVRSLEAGGAASKNAQAMLKQVLPFLLSPSGMESSAKEVQALSLMTLLDIIKKSDAVSLRPFIPELVERFTGLLSSLEPQEVNYLRLNASKYKMTEQKIDDFRLSSVRASPIMEAIERCLDLLDEDSMQKTMQSLQNAIRTSLDLPSKVGASRILVSLSTRHNFLFRPYADQYLQLVERLVRDRNDTVSASFAIAAGYLARIATDKQVGRTITFSKKLYFDSEDDRHRILSGDLIAAILKHASDQASAFSTDILPFVFFGKQDSNEQVQELFKTIWEDNAGGSRAVALYLSEIISISQQHLESPKWVLKHTSSRAVAGAVTDLAAAPDDISLANAEKLWPAIEKAVGGKTWDGKEVALDAFARFVEKTPGYWQGKPEVANQITKIILREARRNNKAYQQAALRALGRVAVARKDIDLSSDVFGIIDPIVEDYAAADVDAMDVDGAQDMSSSQLRDNMLAGSVRCALDCVNAMQTSGDGLLQTLKRALATISIATKSLSRPIHLATFESIKTTFQRFASSASVFTALDLSSLQNPMTELLVRQQISELPEAIRSERAKAVTAVVRLSAGLIDGGALQQAIADEKTAGLKAELEKARQDGEQSSIVGR